MTKRDFLIEAREFFAEGSEERAIADKMIAQLEKKSTKPTKKQVENEGVKAEIAEALGAEGKTAKAIADEVGYSTAKVSALLRQLVADGVATKAEGKGKNPATYARA